MRAGDGPLELLIGVEGLALLRGQHDGDAETSRRRLAEIRELLSGGGSSPAARPREATARVGYASWSERYDEPGNPIIALEQPVVWSILAGLPPGRALDAACGTGRHARRLVDLGWTVTGVDLTPEMLEHARAAVPEATFEEGDLRALPAPDASFDAVVCGLALAHLPDPLPALAELARVLRPGGEAVVTTLHPLQIELGGHAMFTTPDGSRGFVREHAHSHGDYLRAFAQVGLEVRDCIEPVLRDADVAAKRRLFTAIPDACRRAYVGLPAVLAWHLRARGRAGAPVNR